MTVVITTAGFQKAKHPFWLALDWECETQGAEFLDRGPHRSPIVLKYWPDEQRAAMKLWFRVLPPFEEGGTEHFRIDGIGFDVQHVRDGFFQGEVPFEDMERLLEVPRETVQPTPGPGTTDPVEGETFLDACLEVRFDPNDTDKHGYWRGVPLHVPAWLKLESIVITPNPVQGGGAHQILLRCAGLDPGVHGGTWVPMLRINDVWCHLMPMAGWLHHHNLIAQCDPFEMDSIRSYGNGLSMASVSIDALPNEPIPPRDWASIKQVLIRLRRAGRGAEVTRAMYEPWRKDAERVRNLTWGICGSQGQIDLYGRMVRTRDGQITACERHIENSWRRARNRGEIRSLEDWIEQAAPSMKYVRQSIHRKRNYIESKKYWQGNLDHMLKSIVAMTGERNEVLQRLEEREEEYAEFIRYIFPAR